MKLSHLSLAVFSAIALAACGGSGSSSSVGGGDDGHGKDKDDKDKTKVEVVDQGLKSKAKLARATTLTGDLKISNTLSEAVIDGKKEFVLPYTATNSYVKNDSLLNADGTFPGNDISKVFVVGKDGGYVATVKGTAATDGANYLFSSEATTEQKKDPKYALKASDLYQEAATANQFEAGVGKQGKDRGTYVTGIDAYGTSYKITDLKSLPSEFSLDGLKKGELNEGKLSTKYNVLVNKLAANEAGDALEEVANAAGEKELLSGASETLYGKYKAYKQNFSAVVLTYGVDGQTAKQSLIKSSNNVQNADDANGVTIVGTPTVVVPTSTEAKYAGHVVTDATTADVNFDVAFKTDDKYVIKADITNRMQDGKKITKDLTSGSVSGNGLTFTLNLKDKKGTPGVEYNALKGQFFGPNAEEIAGIVDGGTNNGVFSAKQ